jgi:lipopolysaccharide export system permease protein
VGITGVVIAVVGGLVGEFLAPQMDLFARQMRAVAMSGDADMAGSSAWLRDGDLIFNVRPAVDGADHGGVFLFRLGRPGVLTGIGRGDSVPSDDDTAWTLSNFRESRFVSSGVKIDTEIEQERVSKLTDLLAVTAVRDSSLAGRELWAYIKYLRANGLDSDRYEIAFWSRISTIAGIAVMCVLALPFVSGSLRTSGAGGRMIIGVLIGLGYFLLNKTLADSAAVFDLHPFFVAWLPTALLGAIAAIGLARLR